MSWLKLDDTFDTHPKMLALGTARRRWIWTRILLYTCRHESARIPAQIRDAIPEATPKYLADCATIGLVDTDPAGEMIVHDWDIYNGATLADRIAAHLAKHPTATGNEVHKAVGGKRTTVLAIVATMRPEPVPNRFLPGSQLVPETGANGSRSVPEVVPLAGARGPGPSPALESPYLQALPNYEGGRENHEQEGGHWPKLIAATRSVGNPEAITKLERTVRAHHSTERDLVCATEAASGPGVRDPLGVALSELVKRAQERGA